jgi:trehalose 6-phosphate synthase/phosphatase
MSRECNRELDTTVARKWDVDVMVGKANLEVRPTFINKGEICKRLVNDYSMDADEDNRLGFVLCMGDDFTDEDMFRALNGLSSADSGVAAIAPEQTFTVTVGASTKVTLARWHLLEPEDVIDCVALLAGVGCGGSGAASGGVLSMGEVNLAAIASVEGHNPKIE